MTSKYEVAKEQIETMNEQLDAVDRLRLAYELLFSGLCDEWKKHTKGFEVEHDIESSINRYCRHMRFPINNDWSEEETFSHHFAFILLSILTTSRYMLYEFNEIERGYLDYEKPKNLQWLHWAYSDFNGLALKDFYESSRDDRGKCDECGSVLLSLGR